MIRFLRHAIVSGCRLRERALDFLPANETSLESVPDPEVLARAAEQDRIPVTHDFQTMPRHFADFLQAHGLGPRVLLMPQHLPVADAIEEFVLIWPATDRQEWEIRILRIPLPQTALPLLARSRRKAGDHCGQLNPAWSLTAGSRL